MRLLVLDLICPVPPVLIARDRKDGDVHLFAIVRKLRREIGHTLPKREQIGLDVHVRLNGRDGGSGIANILVPIVFEAQQGDHTALDRICLAQHVCALKLRRTSLDEGVLQEDAGSCTFNQHGFDSMLAVCRCWLSRQPRQQLG